MAKFRLRDGSGTIDLKYITEDTDRHGNVRLYVRRPGAAKIRLREVPGTDAFMAEYRAALAAAAERKPPAEADRIARAANGSLRWLCEQYYASGEYRQLDPATRRPKMLILESICGEPMGRDGAPAGEKPYAQMEPRHVVMLRDRKADLPGAANNRVKALKSLFNWAMGPIQLAASNPAAKVPKLRPQRADGHETWGADQCAAFEATHPLGTQARLAYTIMRHTGLRKSDAVALGRQHIRDGWLRMTVSKGRSAHPQVVEIPINHELAAALDLAPKGCLTYLITSFGKPYSIAGFGNAFRAWCDEAGLRGYSAHGIRKTVAVELAEAGASEHELMATHGWRNPRQAETYTRKASRKSMAGAAFAKLATSKSADPVPLDPTMQKSGAINAKK